MYVIKMLYKNNTNIIMHYYYYYHCTKLLLPHVTMLIAKYNLTRSLVLHLKRTVLLSSIYIHMYTFTAGQCWS